MRRASFIAVLCCAAMLGGCSKHKPSGAESAAGLIGVPAVPVAKPLSPIDVAGRWNVSAVPMWKDPLVTHLVLNATGDPSTWTITYPPNRKPIPVRGVMFGGDSLVLDWGPYTSARRKGVQATSHDTYRLTGGKLVGMSVSHYLGTPPDSVRRLKLTGTRVR